MRWREVRSRRAPLLGGALALALVLGALPAHAGPSAGSGSELDRALEGVIDTGIPGAAAAIRGHGSFELLRVGSASINRQKPIGRHDTFRIASVSKSFSAVLIAQLAGDGLLRLNDTVADWLPHLLRHGKEITIAELMQHTSGLPDYVKNEGFLKRFTADLTKRWHPRRVIDFIAEEPLNFRPGSEYEYSDSDNIVLGLIVKRASGRSYSSALRTGILRPLGMDDTSLPHGLGLQQPFVRGYQFDDGDGEGPLVDVSHAVTPSAAWASGAMVSTLSDLTRFWKGLLGGRLVAPRLLSRMIDHTVKGGGSPLGPGKNRSGLGIFAWTMKCGTLYGHTGSFPGYQTFSGATRDGEAVVVMANATSPSSKGTHRQKAAYREAACEAL